MSYHVRWMMRADMDRVAEIENACFSNAVGKDGLTAALRKRNVIGMVAERDGCVNGYMMYAIHRSEIELLAICTCPHFRFRGVARAMMSKLKSKLNPQRRRSIVMHLVDRDLYSQLFLRSQGFVCTDVIQGYDDICDVYRFHFVHPDSLTPVWRNRISQYYV